MSAHIAVLPGDGIGPEVTKQAVRAAAATAEAIGLSMRFEEAAIGGSALDICNHPLPPETQKLCSTADAVLLGAVGGPKWDTVPVQLRPEQGLLALRKLLGVYANLRPVCVHPALAHRSPVKAASLGPIDIVVVRELTGGIYFGAKTREQNSASDLCTYSTAEIERVVRVACRIAAQRSGRLISVDKANVLETSRLWREVATRVVSNEFPEISLEHMLVDAAAMHLIISPQRFDVVVTENMFGDILTDEASAIAGSLGLLPSASLSDSLRGLYEPIHGSAPDLAGTGDANPIGAILSAAMMFRHSLGQEKAAAMIEQAVGCVLESGLLTAELAADPKDSRTTSEVGDAVCAQLEANCRAASGVS